MRERRSVTFSTAFWERGPHPDAVSISKTAVGGGAEIADAVLKITTEDGQEVTTVKGEKLEEPAGVAIGIVKDAEFLHAIPDLGFPLLEESVYLLDGKLFRVDRFLI